jgi:hypothetical protein
MAGMVGSRLSAFPVRLLGDPGPVVTATAPTQLPLTAGAIVSYTPETLSFIPPGPLIVAPAVAPASDVAPRPAFVARVILTPTFPESNDGVWIRYDNARWVSSGRAEPRTGAFVQIGTSGDFPVLRRTGDAEQIFIPTRDGLVAPFRRKG